MYAARSQPPPRAALGTSSRRWLWALRVLVLLLTAMVIYTFLAQLS